MDRSLVERGVLAVGDLIADRGQGGLDGMHVYLQGDEPVEYHWTEDLRRDVFSVSKTFVSAAVGIAEAEGLLSLDDPVLDHLDHLGPSIAAGTETITVDQLLTMTSGIVYRWEDADMLGGVDPAQVVLSAPLGFAPGTRFAYRGGSSYLLSRVINACSGQDVRDYLQSRLFSRLGVDVPSWERCPLGYSIGAVGLELRTAEVARLGQTLLDSGHWKGQQLVPADYVARLVSDPVDADGHTATGSSKPHAESARYGRGVWLCARDNAWRMDGIHGQFSVVLPDQRACITATAHYQGAGVDILDAVWSEIVPVLR